ncbi:MAG: glycosyltransferase [Bacteroidia bacterium]|nr:glycosyltransferase [Bacteroidia bacterium]
MQCYFSFIIPVYNRPGEIQELLESISLQKFDRAFEVVIIEDGSKDTAKEVVDSYQGRLNTRYIFKDNTGPGDSRNVGMQKASGDYFLILDSDCVLPPDYLATVDKNLEEEYVHCFGGPDTDKNSFSLLQRAINYSLTSPLTTGGIRGGKKSLTRFQPRSFNMGISREAFSRSGGFGRIHPGEDPDLVIRLWELGYVTRLFSDAYVYHKRRIDTKSFIRQVYKFGLVRAILNQWHPDSQRFVFWLPSLFCAGIIDIALYFLLGWPLLGTAMAIVYVVYLSLILLHALWTTKNILVAVLSPFTTILQFLGYGFGFIKSTILVNFMKRNPQTAFPQLFF